MNLFIFFVVIVGINVFSGVPIKLFALATFGYLALTTRTPMPVMVGRVEEGCPIWCCWRFLCLCIWVS